MGRTGAGFVALVFLLDLRKRDGGGEPEFSVWRCGRSLGIGRTDGPRGWLARCVFFERGVAGGFDDRQCVVSARDAGAARASRAPGESEECLCRRGARPGGRAGSDRGDFAAPARRAFHSGWCALLAFGTTLLRETFNLWTPTYFVQFVGLSASAAASRSALFPLCGGVSVLLGGFLSDKLGANGRNILVVTGMTACTVCLVLMGRLPGHGRPMGALDSGRAGRLMPCSGRTLTWRAPCRSISAVSAAAPRPRESSMASAIWRDGYRATQWRGISVAFGMERMRSWRLPGSRC